MLIYNRLNINFEVFIMNVCAIILAAGKGKRMRSEYHKGTHKICGKEMVNIIIDKLSKVFACDINVVVGEYKESLINAIGDRGVTYSYQEEQLGTGHAVLCSLDFLSQRDGDVIIFACDMPLLEEDNIKKLIDVHKNNGNSATIITSYVDNPLSYGRIIRENGSIKSIRECKDLIGDEVNIKEINSSIYCFNIKDLIGSISKVNNKNNQNEFYLTDVIEILSSEGKKVSSIFVDKDEIIGVDSRSQLSFANKVLRDKINLKHMENGVTFIDKDSAYIDLDAEIESDVIIYPNVYIEGKSVIKKGSQILPNTRINNSIIHEDTKIESSVILNSKVHKGANIGPFAYIRPGSTIGNNVKIGDFVEIKNSQIGDDTKISHLSYVGDSEVGKGCNLGCGIITVNYDGDKKHKTIIENNCFIGCNTNLIAPVKIHNNSYIAAGTTITEDVPCDTLAIGRCRQINKENWIRKN